jgi:excisionase family DNA binding protein
MKLTFLTIEEVAEMAHCSVRHVHNEKKRGLLKCRKIGRRLIFEKDDVMKWFNRKIQTA